MLLVSDGAPVCRGRDEPLLDCWSRSLCASGKNHASWTLARIAHGHRVDGVGRLADGGNAAVIARNSARKATAPALALAA